MRQGFRYVAAAILLAAMSLGAAAHHSASMFDSQRSITLQGEVREFRFTNPHCWIQLLVTSGGTTTEWSIEMGSPQGLYRSGWRPGSLKAGQQIKVIVHPERDGAPVAQFTSAMRADGQPIVAGKP